MTKFQLRMCMAGTLAAGLPLGCDSSVDEPEGSAPRDNRVQLPDLDDEHHAFVATEVVIEPGEEKMLCFHMTVEQDMALTDVEMLQGEFGHHAVIVSSTDPQPPGTVEDCTDAASSSKFSAFLIPVANPPEGAAMFVEKGTPVVLQSHYVNASDEPILVRDAVTARKIAIDEVTTWMAPMITTALDLEIPAEDGVAEYSFDCVMDRDVDLLFIGGHMHEQGSSFELDIGPSVDELERVYTVDKWIPDFRDLPPVELYTSKPLHMPTGTVLRTTCRWENRTGEMVRFPEEMCVGFGVMAGTKDLYDCRVQ